MKSGERERKGQNSEAFCNPSPRILRAWVLRASPAERPHLCVLDASKVASTMGASGAKSNRVWVIASFSVSNEGAVHDVMSVTYSRGLSSSTCLPYRRRGNGCMHRSTKLLALLEVCHSDSLETLNAQLTACTVRDEGLVQGENVCSTSALDDPRASTRSSDRRCDADTHDRRLISGSTGR